ncbi:Lar family restriction alleviation protein [Parvibacter caecicola]|uniref:DNA-directed RNA polymerase subunit RPC12/RpoP n=1 Tax=Parvibacter caecicola TaxID=747645 RepID=A0A7W5GQR0_9ACTN|nr:Lar family restriction alleviation protein [Parvibacter caecicola]MBB3171781.1 DNA-directed RNA polymerase subunit RPC12/RpoP [Parvibacter caecicola]MCR2040657.1 Lar family restriction alleviation protein [Parvibacter caecicola]RNL10833.1 hypothetical protein DMP11_06195 [Parvibacter caecicola]
MSDELKLCPFCGSGNLKIKGGIGRYVKCLDCENGAHLPGRGCTANDGDAVAAWNTRAAVTEEQFAVAVHNGEAWQKVRECHDVDESSNFFRCSQCGCEIMRCVDGWKPLYMGEVNFCPNCGAKVVM